MTEEKKTRIPLWIYPSTMEEVDLLMEKDNCRTRSEFIEKAVQFYCGYLKAEQKNTYLPVAVSSAIEGRLGGAENRISRLLFKLAVETSMMMNILAGKLDVEEVDLGKLRGKCLEEVKRSNGSITFEEVLRYQRRL